MDLQKTGKFIAERRKLLCYTQEDLGNALGVSDKAVSKWERGISFPDISSINQLAVLLKTNVLSLITGEPDNKFLNSNIFSLNQEPTEEFEIPKDDITLTLSPSSSAVSPYLFGTNLEHSRYSVYFGLSAQMLKNRKFAGMPGSMRGCAIEWYAIGSNAHFAFSESYTKHSEHYHMSRRHECNAQKIINFKANSVSGIGQHGIYLQKNTAYQFAVVVKSSKPVTLNVSFTSSSGQNYVTTQINTNNTDWQRYKATLTSPVLDPNANLEITFSDAACLNIGAVSLMPANNFHGMRYDVIEALKTMGVKVLRWPGGNYAGEYNWLDGLIPIDMRAPFESHLGIETHPQTMGYDYSEINTDDFIALCREVGAQAYLTINQTWNTAEENAAWVEYCNGGTDTKYGKIRAKRGYKEPYNVQLWSLGNEAGYVHMEGDNTPYGYCSIAKEHGSAMREVCSNVSFCSSGPHPNKDWADHVANPLGNLAKMVSMHYYAPEFDPLSESPEDLKSGYYKSIYGFNTARENINQLRGMLNNNLKISFDEWNTWYAWYRYSSVTDGIFTALMLHMIINEAEPKGIAISCHYEAINEGAIEVTPTTATLTATGQMFSVMKHHINGIIYYSSEYALATAKNDVLTITAVNACYDSPKKVFIPKNGEIICGDCYRGKEILPHSVFNIEPLNVKEQKNGLEILLPERSVALLQIKLNP